MNSFQRIIKFTAMAFAIFLAVGIVTGIASLVLNIISAVTGTPIFGSRERIDMNADLYGVESLEIENIAGTLNIKIGDIFRVEAENVLETFTAEVSDGGTLKISEYDKHGFLWFDFNWLSTRKSNITVYIPADFVAEEVKLRSGAGNVTIEALRAENLMIECGIGDLKGYNIAAEKTKVDGGVGNLTLTNVNLKNANIDCGIGEVRIEGKLLGDSKIDCGVGGIDIDITGRREDYDLDVDAGVGTIRVDGKKHSDSDNSRKSEHSIKVDGGIGKVRIDFLD